MLLYAFVVCGGEVAISINDASCCLRALCCCIIDSGPHIVRSAGRGPPFIHGAKVPKRLWLCCRIVQWCTLEGGYKCQSFVGAKARRAAMLLLWYREVSCEQFGYKRQFLIGAKLPIEAMQLQASSPLHAL
eukprot:gnl/TRDRNA2_/TRDRNA2_190705_c0_seq1.p1 gnl/TRDRNA2_/TRDRNA2_190705_c0~~gnl/TRDRNA2_/TRDRNA2_190705_c0_seq1.p1  ORF type:complete len:131 (+),score=10.40 gnl/TRDRNA2_/TRDRNA2_190705_c0_seq1:75-467(+)